VKLDSTATRRLLDARLRLRRAQVLSDENPEATIALFDAIVADLEGDVRLPARGRVAEAMFFKSQALFDLGEAAAALTLVDALVVQFSVGEAPLRRRVMHALFVTVFTLRLEHPERAETALALCTEAVRRFGSDTDLCVRERLLSLFVDQARILESFGRTAEGLALAREIAARYEAEPDPTLRARALRVAEATVGRFADG
jgi:hypothetical protein